MKEKSRQLKKKYKCIVTLKQQEYLQEYICIFFFLFAKLKFVLLEIPPEKITLLEPF